jgi:hypothetical protein
MQVFHLRIDRPSSGAQTTAAIAEASAAQVEGIRARRASGR